MKQDDKLPPIPDNRADAILPCVYQEEQLSTRLEVLYPPLLSKSKLSCWRGGKGNNVDPYDEVI